MRAEKPSPRGKVGSRSVTGGRGRLFNAGNRHFVKFVCDLYETKRSKFDTLPLPPIAGTLWEPTSCPLASHTRRVSLDTLAPAPRCFGSTVQHKRYSIVCASLTPRGRLFGAYPHCLDARYEFSLT